MAAAAAAAATTSAAAAAAVSEAVAEAGLDEAAAAGASTRARTKDPRSKWSYWESSCILVKMTLFVNVPQMKIRCLISMLPFT